MAEGKTRLYDSSVELAKALTATPEFIRYNQLVEKACRDEATRKLFSDYKNVVERYQHAEMGRERAFTDEELERMDELIDKVEAVPELALALEALSDYETAFNRSMDLIQKMTRESMYDIDSNGSRPI